MPARYRVEVRPLKGMLGEAVTAVLGCTAGGASPNAMTFGHKSLVLEINAEGLLEPILAFPNRFAVEDGDRLVRMSAPGGTEDLSDGEQRTRTFDLLAMFPGVVLRPGAFSFTYRLEEARPPVRPNPVTVEIQSGPEAVPLLIRHLESESTALGDRAHALLRRMTGKDFAGSAGWSAWWGREGTRLPWSRGADGAVPEGGAVQRGAPDNAARLGGVDYRTQPGKPR
jgi:hypothetical protein